MKKLIERKQQSEQIYKGRLLDVNIDHVLLPDGTTSTREWIRHPGASAILPVYENGDILLLSQFRYPMSQIFYEVPAGKIDEGEDPLQTAIRELAEESGLRAGTMRYVGHFYPSIGYTDELIHIYAAWNLTQSESRTDDDEFLLPERMPFREALKMVGDGIISDGKTIISLYRVWKWWQEKGPFEI